jgi:Reverse transcriptase (RNA-dependent DNA polymerase)
MEQTVVIRIDGKDSEAAKIGRGVRQGCPMSPKEFNIYIVALMNKAMENEKKWRQGRRTNCVRCEICLRSSNGGQYQRSLQRIMNSLHKTSEEYGMKVYLKKSIVMQISRNEGRKITIKIYGEQLEHVTQFNYLGSTITEDCKSSSEMRRRIILGIEAFNKNEELLPGKLELVLKKWLMKTLIWN